MMPPSLFSASLGGAAFFTNTEVNAFPRVQGFANLLQRFCRGVRRRLCLSRKPGGRIVWFDRHMPWMDSPTSALAEMERLGHTSHDNNKRRSRGLRRIFRRDAASSRRSLVVVSPYDQIFLPATLGEESRSRYSESELLWNSVQARRPSLMTDGDDEEVDSDDWGFGSEPTAQNRSPTLPVVDRPLGNPNPPVILHERIIAGPSLSSRDRPPCPTRQRIPSRNLRVRTCHVRSDNVIVNRPFGPPTREDAPPRYSDDRSPPRYFETALPVCPLYRLHDGTLLDIHHAALRADGFIRYDGDDTNRIPRLGIRGRLYLELQDEHCTRDGVPIALIFEQHQGEGLPDPQRF
ncbi:hypothetical protein E4U54_001803 [Claviceps lovelessii]|nr:hypothetical protein E4U54_001803 [Claviceps lovelessii]